MLVLVLVTVSFLSVCVSPVLVVLGLISVHSVPEHTLSPTDMDYLVLRFGSHRMYDIVLFMRRRPCRHSTHPVVGMMLCLHFIPDIEA